MQEKAQIFWSNTEEVRIRRNKSFDEEENLHNLKNIRNFVQS